MKVAVVHDWLVTYAGSERVLKEILGCFPEADLFSLIDFLPPSQRDFLAGKTTETSFIQKLPFAKTKYRQYLPIMPRAIERFDLSGYDMILSSSHAVAKGVRTHPGQLHISYVHSPMRYAWDLREQYLTEAGLNRGIKGWLVRGLLDRLKDWDKRNSASVGCFIANSQFIAGRIKNNYGRSANVIYPPVDVENFSLKEKKENFYLTASRMVPYKKMDLIVEAFSKCPEKQLVVIGDGPDFEKIKRKAGPNISFLGFQPYPVLKDYLQRAKGFVFAAIEDFGIIVVEAQACGTPVIAFGAGGALETVRGLDRDRPTGVFFEEQTVSGLLSAVKTFEANQARLIPQNCRKNSEEFSRVRFQREYRVFVEQKVNEFYNSKNN